VSCGVGCRCGSDPALLWLWRRPVATALIQPLAWEPPYAAGAALEKAKRPKKTETKTKTKNRKQTKNEVHLYVLIEKDIQGIQITKEQWVYCYRLMYTYV